MIVQLFQQTVAGVKQQTTMTTIMKMIILDGVIINQFKKDMKV